MAGASVGFGCASQNASITEPCAPHVVDDFEIAYETREANVEVTWYDEWVSRFGKTLPEPLPPAPHWQHPILSGRYAGTMHEDSLSTDVSAFAGPTPNEARVEYVNILEKGERLTGMAPLYEFLDENTVVTIAFGRDAATLLVIDVSGAPKILDQVDLPGRGYGLLDLASSSSRKAAFRDTSGGAYSYLDRDGNVHVPGHDNTVIQIPIRNRRIVREEMTHVNLIHEMEEGSIVHHHAARHQDEKINRLTAIMPDADGRIWFTSKYGIVGVFDPGHAASGCPRVYATSIFFFAIKAKIRELFQPLPPSAEKVLAHLEQAKTEQHIEDVSEVMDEFRELFLGPDSEFTEEIQNSFSVGPDGVYVVTNIALYKLRFNEEARRIELDPKWAPTYAQGDLIYDNDHTVKPGHLNAGSGTTPTLVLDDHVVIVDNAPSQVNLLAFRQSDGSLVSKIPLFQAGAAAVENSVVAYGHHLIVGNTYGYTDPFRENPTAGGIARFDFDEEKGTYVPVEGWPATGHLDAKTATPKLSLSNGLIYIYNRDTDAEGYSDWQLTALDFRTGYRVFRIKGYFEEGAFRDDLSRIVKKKSLGKLFYDRKVFNNIWATFTFGPRNSIYIGAYRGFVRFSSQEGVAATEAP
ncbi:MAG TPA: hypothetical protein VFG22_01705 [Polyangiales bacterium]|jgi:hypothetical protein|nr:hypothetical protein [Polyangiales bacterium]